MDTKAHNKYSDTVLDKMVGGTPLFSPRLPEKDSTRNGHSQTKRRGQRTAATQCGKHRGWVSGRPNESSELTWQQKEAQTTDPGRDQRPQEGRGVMLNTRGQRQEGDPQLLPSHTETQPLLHPSKDRSRGRGRGVGEVIGDKNRELKRTATSRTSRASAFFLLWLPDVGHTL